MLCRSYFVMLCLCRHTQLPEFLIYFLHKPCNTGSYSSVIMILHLLAFGGHGPKQGPSGEDKVFSFQILLSVYQEIFLLGTYRYHDLLGRGVTEQTHQTQSLIINGLH